jgi:putative sensory transduction regulator
VADELGDVEHYRALIESWLAKQLDTNPIAVAVDHDPDPSMNRWFLRLRGEDRDFTTIWLTLGQRTLQYETYFLPDPEESKAEVYEYLLRRNHKLFGMRFSIGPEDAIYLVGQMPLVAVDEGELDRVVGSTYAYVEQYFRAVLHMAFASRFRS